jgi:YVTN family beta-propeller protein
MARIVSVGMLCVAIASGAVAQGPPRSVSDPGVITTRQAITPAGVQAIFNGRVLVASFCGSDQELTVAAQSRGGFTLHRLGLTANRTLATYTPPDQRTLGLQGMTCRPQTRELLLSMSARQGDKNTHVIELLPAGASAPTDRTHVETTMGSGSGDTPVFGDRTAWQTAATLSGTLPNAGTLGGVSIAAHAPIAVAALTASNRVAVIDLEKKAIAQQLPVGIAPFTAAVNGDGTIAWVSNWAGRVPQAGDPTAPTGPSPTADRVVIDQRGVAATGTISRVDLKAGRQTQEITVGLHPTALVWDEPKQRLYVANSNSDAISVIDTTAARVVATWEIQPFQKTIMGVAPTALGLSKDGQQLFVTCAGINAVAVLRTSTGAIDGLIPTAWYPNTIALSPNGNTLAVTTLLGVGSGADIADNLKIFRAELPNLEPGPSRRYVHAYRGTVHVIPVPDATQLAAYSRSVAENNRLPLRADAPAAAPQQTRVRPAPRAVPEQAGDPSLIEHVVYIVKENRTYDQLFGDLERGNGDPSLVLYGEDTAANHRKLAREFVVLDNFFATGGNSGEGHQWVTQSSETEYTHFPGYGGRSYPFDGNDPIAYAKSGFLWDAALARAKTFANFGEFIPSGQYGDVDKQAGRLDTRKLRQDMMEQWKAGEQFVNRFNVKSPIPPLDAHLVREFPSYGVVPDVVRARIFLRHLKQWEQSGTMPNLTYIQLPIDHTGGTSPGYCTPKACVADNDLALGQIVEGITHSKFWPKTAIFVVEDDAQGGLDHVDGHRTVALLISPYVKRQAVDSTFYSHPSIAKTIELILGLPNLSLFDLIAHDMRNSFTNTPDLTPYTAVTPQQSIFEVNPNATALRGQARRDAVASAKMNWAVPDAVPSAELNRILWRRERGAKPYPGTKQALFAPYALADEDDKDEARER